MEIMKQAKARNNVSRLLAGMAVYFLSSIV